MPTQKYWFVYKIFHDPPGTPKDLRCVKCKVATSGAAFLAAAPFLYLTKETIKPRIYLGATYGFISLLCLSVGVIGMKMAAEDNKWNNEHIKTTLQEMKKFKRERENLA